MTAVVPPSNILIATGAHLVEHTRQCLPFLPTENILAEPTARNTAPCIAWANAVIRRRDPNAIVAVLSADHVATDEVGFQSAVTHAMQVAASGIITTLGIQPTRPEAGYGYIEKGAARGDGAFEALRFVEKPDLERAHAMLESGKFLWNAGFFFFHSQQMVDAIREHLPLLAEGVDALNRAAADGHEQSALEKIFPAFPSVSIDVGVMEKVKPLAVVPANFGWSDVGSWQTAWELAPKDDSRNAVPNKTITIDASGNIVADWTLQRHEKVVALIGVHDLVVVQTEDALLVMPRDRSQDVRQVIDALREQGRTDKL